MSERQEMMKLSRNKGQRIQRRDAMIAKKKAINSALL
jgi:hypothetical protein